MKGQKVPKMQDVQGAAKTIARPPLDPEADRVSPEEDAPELERCYRDGSLMNECWDPDR